VTYRRLAAVAALITLAFALLGSAAWITGRLELASLLARFIPMAPTTAVGLVVVGAALLSLALGEGTNVRRAVRVASALVLIITSVGLFDLQTAFIGQFGTFGEVPLGRMSPLTITTLGMVGLAIWCVTSVEAPAVLDFGGMLGSLALLMGTIVSLGYAYGAPLLYGGTVVPMALPTGLAFMSAGVALVALAGPTSVPLRLFSHRATLAEAERKQAEEALRQVEILSRNLVEDLPQRIVVKDRNSVFLFCNRNFATDMGTEPAQIVGKDDFAFFPRALAEGYRNDDRMVMAAGRIKDTEEKYKAAGKDLWVHTRKVPYHDHRGEVIGVVVVFEDITERKQAEEAARHREAELQESQRIAGIGSWEVAGATGVATWSEEMDHLLRRDHRLPAPTFENLPRFFTPESWDRLRAAHARTIETGAPFELELEMIGADGGRRWTTTRGEAIRGADGTVLKLRGTVHDITRHKEADENLRLTAERLSLATESAGIGIWVRDVEKHTLLWDKRMYELYGVSQEDVQDAYEAMRRGMHPEDVAATQALVDDAIARRGELHTQVRVVWPDGRVRYLEAHGAVHDSSDGKGRYLIGVNWDVTERMRAEEAGKHREAELRESQRIAGVGSWERTIATGVIAWSEGMNRLLGRDRSLPAPALETVPDFYTPESWERLRSVVATTIETGAPYELELEMIGADGRHRWTTTRGEAVCGPDGTVVKTRGTVHDITGLKEAAGALRLQSAALNAAANAIVITDRDGKIEWINAAFTSMTGYSPAEALGKTTRELLRSGVHDQALYKDLWDTLLAGNVWHGIMTNRRKDGSLYTEDQVITPVKDVDGVIGHFIAIKADLTEQRQLEAQFLQAQKMEIVGRLAGGIAHDFNNLLTVINGMSELAALQLQEDDPLRSDVEEIRQAGARAATLTRQLLAFSRKQIMETEVFRLGTLVADMQRMLQRLIGENVTLVVVPAKDGDTVMADRGQMEQIVLNLSINARDAMPEGGVVTVETQVVALDKAHADARPPLHPGPHVLLSVSDTGVGMDETVRRRAFEPFFTTKEPGKGTGLGLSTVYGIVKQSGGSIELESEPGRGTSCKIYLPWVGDVARVGTSDQPGAKITAGGETILVVEDEPALRRLAERVLKSVGYTVLTARSSEEALLLLEANDTSLHLLLTDVVLPGINGFDLATRATERRPEIKVLFMSGYADDAMLRHGMIEKGAHFISKPYTAAALTSKIREVLETA
jgi:two-component system, cell cycle sensor histidine kinase and response regulator CckA